MNRQRLGIPLAVLVLVLVLAACQGGRAGQPPRPPAERGCRRRRPSVPWPSAAPTPAPASDLTRGQHRPGPEGRLLPRLELAMPAGGPAPGPVPPSST